MIDLHCHILPAIDDGSDSLDTSLEMARMAVADGIKVMACTPHIYPGLYENDAPGIRRAIGALQQALDAASIPLKLTIGADVHLAPDLAARIRAGEVPTLNDTRYLLLEPPHHVAPPRFEESVFELIAGGWVPVITHPERLTWVEQHYEAFRRLVDAGAWMQITSGSLTGRFGKHAQRMAERMLDDGLVYTLATDSHGARRRPPLLAEGRDAAALRVGDEEARHLVQTRPLGILQNRHPEVLPPLPQRGLVKMGWWSRVFGRAGQQRGME
jgi:protein-tyrosine phosphatase